MLSFILDWGQINIIATCILAFIGIFALIIAKIQLSIMASSQVAQLITSLNEKIDNENMRKERREIYKKYNPLVQRPKEININDFEMMEKIANYFDVVAKLVLENRQLRKKALDLWAISFYRCWLCMEPYIIQERIKRGDKNYLINFQKLFIKSKYFLGETTKTIQWY